MSCDLANITASSLLVNVAITAVLLIITAFYSWATYRISKLEKERKVWDVTPIIIIKKKFISREIQGSIDDSYWTSFIIKNVGRGPANITLFNDKDTSNTQWKEIHHEKFKFETPIWLEPNGEIMLSKKPTSEQERTKFKFNDLNITINYENIHGNQYYTELSEGKTSTGKR